MNRMTGILLIPLLVLLGCGDSGNEPEPTPSNVTITVSPEMLDLSASAGTENITVNANAEWGISSGQGWCKVSPSGGVAGNTVVKVSVEKNSSGQPRIATLTFTSGKFSQPYIVTQEGLVQPVDIPTPPGYSLVWQEEFNESRLSDGRAPLLNTEEWWYENLAQGAVNNELQTYVGGFSGTDTVASVYDGTLKIVARKQGDKVISARVNTNESWTYGYFEARLKVPGGKGTWPAFWMMPKNFNNWPDDGEIDIMEYVGFDPNVMHSSIHCKAYYHSIGTQKTGTKKITNAETEFHVYAVEWTSDYIKGFVDGEEYFRFDNDKKGNKDTWPFNTPFYLKLNLAWGGDWGGNGTQDVDETKLPATYEIDYVRVFQKN